MAKEKRNNIVGDPFKMFLKEAPTRQRNKMMDKFYQILRCLPMATEASLINNHFICVMPFKVNCDISLFEGQIDANSLEKWLNILEGYYSIQKFSDDENITFSLLNLFPMLDLGGKVTRRGTPWMNLCHLGDNPLG
jgi:hypothetical protein